MGAPVAAAAPMSTNSAALGLSIGQKVVAHGKPGTVRYMGTVSFAGGDDWVGVELDAPTGMHDGTLFGKTYFESKPKHGIFIKASQLGGSMPAAAPVAAAAASPVAAAAPPSTSG